MFSHSDHTLIKIQSVAAEPVEFQSKFGQLNSAKASAINASALIRVVKDSNIFSLLADLLSDVIAFV